MQEVIRKCDFKMKGKPCGERVPEDAPTSFILNNVTYEMDLCERHYEDFSKVLEPFMHIAEPTRTRSGKAVRAAIKGKKGTFTTKDVRQWLVDQGRDVSPTGRIPNSLIEEYKVAVGA